MTNNEILNNASYLESTTSKYRGKFLRNLRLYTYSINASLSQVKNGNLIGYWALSDGSGYTSSINENVIQSCVDYLTSMIAAKHAVPSCDAIDGTYAEERVAKQLQKYFDFYYDEKNINKLITEAFRDACIFGRGYIFYDTRTHSPEKALPWNVLYDNAEETYGKISKVVYKRPDYPVSLLPWYKPHAGEKYVEIKEYFDTKAHIRATIINNRVVHTEPYNDYAIPFISLYYVAPIYGRDTTSMVDQLYGIQMKIDELYSKIDEASRMTPSNTIIVPKNSDVKTTQLSNKIGQILQYNPIEGVTNPVTVLTPNFIGGQYMELVEKLKQDAYNITGCSELGAQSKKPAGLDSGKALKTLNDIESARFEVQSKQVIRAYTDLAKLIVRIENPELNVMPEDNNRFPITWGQAQAEYSKMKIKFTSLDFFSNDPTQKAIEIKSLIDQGIISRSHVARFYDSNDLDAAYSFANASLNAVEAVINQAVVNHDFTVPEYVPLDMLSEEIITTMLSLKSVENEQNAQDIESLKKLYDEVVRLKTQIVQHNNESAKAADEQAFRTQLQRQADTIVNQQVATANAQLQANQLLNTITNNTGENI